MSARVERGDVLEVLRGQRANSYHAMLSDPPYGIGLMGKAWDAVVPPAEVWRECYRVLRPGAYALVFGGTRTFHRLACALEDAGFEIRDCLCFLYGKGFPKSHNVALGLDAHLGVTSKVTGTRKLTGTARIKGCVGPHSAGRAAELYATREIRDTMTLRRARSAAGRAWEGYGTALKPAWEPVLLVRKPMAGTVAANVIAWGAGALALDACRIDAKARPQRVRGGSRAPDGAFECGLRGSSRAAGETDLGRWPANVIVDGDAAAHLDAVVGKLPSGGVSTRTGQCAQNAFGRRGAHAGGPAHEKGGGPSRFFYCTKVSPKERAAGLDAPCAHPTLKPIALTTYLARLLLVPSERARLLVPFSGAGSEMIGARRAGWPEVFGIERDAGSVRDAKARLRHWERAA